MQIKEALTKIGLMRPRSLTLQYKNTKKKTGPYWQLSYTRKMRSHTDYVKKDMVQATREQIDNYKRFKALTDEWVELSIVLAKTNASQGKG